MNILKEKWYVVNQPWGDGDWIRAGTPDAAGEFVCDCSSFVEEDNMGRIESAHEIAEHIVKLHNLNLKK